MAIKAAPKWAKGAVPTSRGWERNGEILIARKHSAADLKAWEEANAPKPAKKKRRAKKKKVEEQVKKEAQVLTEAPVGNKSLDEMNETEKELVETHYDAKGEEINEDNSDKNE